jgi:hypothetical protein
MIGRKFARGKAKILRDHEKESGALFRRAVL